MRVCSDGYVFSRQEFEVLQLVAKGYPTKGVEDRYIIVENPDFRPDNGLEPNLVVSLMDKTDY